jgi:Sec-independent protein secretion pathway component TatC
LFIIGCYLGALMTAVLVAIVVMAARSQSELGARYAVAVILTVAILRSLGLPIRLPYRRQQVPESWRREGPLTYAALAYGTLLGIGFATPFVTAAHAAFLLAIPFLNHPYMLLVAPALYALGRASSLLLGAGACDLETVNQKIYSSERPTSLRRSARLLSGIAVSSLVMLAVLQAVPR